MFGSYAAIDGIGEHSEANMETRPFYIRLTHNEATLLRAMAAQDMRPTRDQVRWLIVKEAARRGMQTGDCDRQEANDERRPA